MASVLSCNAVSGPQPQTALSASLETPQLPERQATEGPFQELAVARANRSVFLLRLLLFCVAMRIMRIVVVFLLAFFLLLQ